MSINAEGNFVCYGGGVRTLPVWTADPDSLCTRVTPQRATATIVRHLNGYAICFLSNYSQYQLGVKNILPAIAEDIFASNTSNKCYLSNERLRFHFAKGVFSRIDSTLNIFFAMSDRHKASFKSRRSEGKYVFLTLSGRTV